jgi:hypothetical protein
MVVSRLQLSSVDMHSEPLVWIPEQAFYIQGEGLLKILSESDDAVEQSTALY